MPKIVKKIAPHSRFNAFIVLVWSIVTTTFQGFSYFLIDDWFWATAASLAATTSTLILDYYMLPFFEMTMKNLEKKKISRTQAFGYIFGVFVSFVIQGFALKITLGASIKSVWEIVEGISVRRTLLLVGILGLTDVFFTLAHGIVLHRWNLASHTIHHASRQCSYHSGTIFHPLDLVAEFSLPVAVLIGCNYFIGDVILFFQCYIVLVNWYMLDHDAQGWHIL